MKKVCFLIIFLSFLIFFAIPTFASDNEYDNVENYDSLLFESLNMEYIQLTKNYDPKFKITPEYIVVHETGGYGTGQRADRLYQYWNREDDVNRSVHFIIDDEHVLQILSLDSRAWHVGDNHGHSDIKNENSIGIEICVNKDGDYAKARAMTIRLVRYLMQELDIDAEHVVRHYDASGKVCPEIMTRYYWMWDDFKYQLGKPDFVIDELYQSIEKTRALQDVKYSFTSNNTIESKLVFDRYSVPTFVWNLFKVYEDKESVVVHEYPTITKRTLQNLSISDYNTVYQDWSISDMFDVFVGNKEGGLKAIAHFHAVFEYFADSEDEYGEEEIERLEKEREDAIRDGLKDIANDIRGIDTNNNDDNNDAGFESIKEEVSEEINENTEISTESDENISGNFDENARALEAINDFIKNPIEDKEPSDE